MKVCSIVGVRKSGKTTVVTELVKELKRRNFKVGTIKTVFCPTFSIDAPKSNSAKHRKSGADLVCIKAKNETDIMYPYGMQDNDIISMIDADYLLLEGDYEAAVPRIICAHNEDEIIERMNEYVFAISGRIAETNNEFKGIPVFNILDSFCELADMLEEKLTDIKLPIEILEIPKSVEKFCQCGCHKNEKQQTAKMQSDLRVRKTRNSAQKHIFLTGEKQIGKSTIIRKLMKLFNEPLMGYLTKSYEIEGVQKGYYMHSIKDLESIENNCPISIKNCADGAIPIRETFETLGVKILENARENNGILILDEIGRFESHAENFKTQIMTSLDTQKLVIGVLQKTHSEFIDSIKARDDVEIYEVTKENREDVFELIKKELRLYWK